MGCIGLARYYESLSLWGEVERCCQRSLEIHKAQLGDQHPDTAKSLNNLAMFYYETDRLSEAAQMMAGVVEIFEELLGAEHPNTITVKKNLAVLQRTIRQQESNWISRVRRWVGF